MKTGISLPWNYLLGIFTDTESRVIHEQNRDPASFLLLLKEWKVQSIEYRHLPDKMEAKILSRSFRMADECGLNITIHGEIDVDHDSKDIKDSFPWLMPLLETCNFSKSNPVITTVHPVKTLTGSMAENRKKTLSILKKYCADIEKHSLPVLIAYENQRGKEFIDPAVKYEDVADTVRETCGNIGICWDMGHGYSNFTSGLISEAPPVPFIEKTIHTHIHALSAEKGATHWPLSHGNLPVEKYINLLLDAGYSGYFNLELSTDRFSALDINNAIKNSINAMEKIELQHRNNMKEQVTGK